MLTRHCAGCRINSALAQFLEREQEGALRRGYGTQAGEGLPEELIIGLLLGR